jgi:hypothetical protein
MTVLYPRERVKEVLQPLSLATAHRIVLKPYPSLLGGRSYRKFGFNSKDLGWCRLLRAMRASHRVPSSR